MTGTKKGSFGFESILRRSRSLAVIGAWTIVSLSATPAEAQDEDPAFSLIFFSRSEVCEEGGELVVFEVRGLLVTRDPKNDGGHDVGAGATGWVASVSATDCRVNSINSINSINTVGTVAASVDASPPGLFDGGFQLNALTEPIDGSCEDRRGAVIAVTLTPNASVALDPASSPHHIFTMTIVTRLSETDGKGLQGWSIAVGLTNPPVLAGATVKGTVAAKPTDDPPGIMKNGFSITELVDPDSSGFDPPGPQGQGAISATVLSFVEPVTSEPDGTATVLKVTVEAGVGTVEESIDGKIWWPNTLRGSGNPSQTVATVNGETRRFDILQEGLIEFRPSDGPVFVRCDPKADSRMDVSDALAVLGFLFLGRPVGPCQESIDWTMTASSRSPTHSRRSIGSSAVEARLRRPSPTVVSIRTTSTTSRMNATSPANSFYASERISRRT